MPLSQLRKLADRLNIHSRTNARGNRTAARPAFNLDRLEQRLLLSVVAGVTPTVDLTDRLNGATNGDPQLNTAINVDGALYTNDIDIAEIGAGSGVLKSFVRISDNTVMVEGYNTSGRPVQYQENTSPTFTHDLPLAIIPLSYFDVDGDGTEEAYRQFRLDINENDTDPGRWESVDAIQIWQSDDPGLNSGFVPAGAEASRADYLTIGFVGADGNYLVHSLDAGNVNNWIGMNYTLNAGSGVADLVLLVPDEFFDPDLDYVYLYSQFGNESGLSDIVWDSDGDFINDETLLDRAWGQGDGFEEWAIIAGIPGEKSGVKFEDLNANGIQDSGEDGIEGWTIYAYEDENGDGLLQAGEGLFASTTTSDGTTDVNGDGVIDPIGSYWFSLPSVELNNQGVPTGGSYIILEEARAGWIQSTPGDDVIDTGTAPGASEFGYAITLSPGERDSGNDFGNYEQATKSGIKYEDENADGIFNGSDAGLIGWTITAFAEIGTPNGVLSQAEIDAGAADSDTTDGTGAYSLTLDPGDYIVVESDQTGWFESPDADTTQVNPGDLGGYGEYGYAINLTSGQTDSGNDFANYQAATKSGIKYEDENADGIFNGSDAGLIGWTITAFAEIGTPNGVLSQAEIDAGAADSDTTDGTGAYSLTLDPGDYIVVESDQTGWFESPDADTTQVNPGDLGGYGEYGYAINLTSGQTDSGNDFANYQAATKSGIKYEDENADGIFNGSDAGLIGWTITAFAEIGTPNGVLSQAEIDAGAADSDTTDGTGAYSLTLDPGDYIVVESDQTGWFESPDADTTQVNPGDLGGYGEYGYAINLTSGQTDSGNDFANYQAATKSGIKYEDENADGIFNGSDAGLIGWTITAFAEIGTPNGVLSQAEIDAGAADSDTTDGTGAYSLTLDPGDYIVVESDQTGWFESPDADTTQVNPGDLGGYGEYGYAINLTSGQTDSGNDFANYQAATKSGIKYEDENADGIFNGSDAGLIGWTITAFAEIGTPNGVLSQAEIDAGAADSDTTDGTGAYSLTLDPGDYIVVESDQTGWFESPDADTTQVNPGDLGGYGEYGYAINLTSGETDSGNDFGNYQLASKSGYKYEDMDGDGNIAEDTGHPLANWEIHLDGTDGMGNPVALVTSTNGSGYYEFTGLVPGNYTVSEVLPDGTWNQSFPSGAGTHVITLTSGENEMGNDFGNWQEGSIHGFKFADANISGTFDAGELKLEGWTIFLDDDGDGVLDPGEVSTVTGVNGEYHFEDLAPGTYRVREVLESGGWYQTTSGPADIVLLSGQEYVAYDGQATLAPHQEQVIQEDLKIGNYIPTGDARTPGFWSNKNGAAEIVRMIGDGIDVWDTLSSLNLRNENGSHFNPTNHAQFAEWLLNGEAKNMAYMLSVQLAAMQLNVLAGFVSTGDTVLVDSTPIAIGDLMSEANSLLGTYGVVKNGKIKVNPAVRHEMSILKGALDAANNNLSWYISSSTLSLTGLEISNFKLEGNLLSII